MFPTIRKVPVYFRTVRSCCIAVCLLLVNTTSILANQSQVYPHKPTAEELSSLYIAMEQSGVIENFFVDGRQLSIGKAVKVLKTHLDDDREPELIIFPANSRVCGLGDCRIFILKKMDYAWQTIGTPVMDESSLILYDRKTKEFRDIRFPGDKFHYVYNPEFKEYECHHCPGEEDNKPGPPPPTAP